MMREDRALMLLGDFAMLIKKHGPTALSDLALILRDRGHLDDLISLLEAGTSATVAAKRSSRRGAAGQQKPPAKNKRVLQDRELEDGPKRDLFLTLQDALTSKRFLPTLSDMRAFARDHSLEAISSSSREKALRPFIRDILSRAPEQIEAVLGHLEADDHSVGDRSLERWAGVILDKQHSKADSN